MKRALISVSDKTGVVEFARGLSALGFEIISTGGTYNTLQEAGVDVRKVADITGFPEILDGRVKTLHPRIHGGILARRTADHLAQLAEHDITAIDLVAVNLYPFRQTVAKPGVTLEEAIENIDIGGPSMVRSAAKNHADVIVVVKPERYGDILKTLQDNGNLDLNFRRQLAQEAFGHTAAYDAMISNYLAGITDTPFPDNFVLAGEKVYELRYGENPHQKACFYRDMSSSVGLADARQLNGKELSYNNIIDTQAAWQLVKEFKQPACVIIKHTNPCGTAVADTVGEAYDKAFGADPVSAFGGIIAFNRELDEKTASKVAEPFMEVIIAPSYAPKALEILQAKKNLRLLELPLNYNQDVQVRTVEGGLVVQDSDLEELDVNKLQVVAGPEPSEAVMADLLFAWKVVKHVKSNAIVLAGNQVTLGVGAGQMNRVGSAKIALEQAGDKARGAVMASDAFFPFKDTVELAAQFGVTAIIQPGGSVRDEESIQACQEHNITMIFTGVRHFKH